MLVINGFAAYVEIEQPNGGWTPAVEYKVTTPDPHSATCFIESVSGCKFRIVFQDECLDRAYRDTDIAVRTMVDGQLVGTSGLKSDRKMLAVTIKGKSYGSAQIFPFVFGKVKLTDDDDLATRDEQVVKHVGSIQLNFHRVSLGGLQPRQFDYMAPTEHTLHERAKKGRLDHSTAFGPSESSLVPSTSYQQTIWKDDVKAPWYQLEFRYRSGDLLEVEGIKPPAAHAAVVDIHGDRDSVPPVAPRGEKRKAAESIKIKKMARSKTQNQVIDLDSDEDNELERLRRENAELRKKVTIEKPVKTEPVAKSKGKVIDLSDD